MSHNKTVYVDRNVQNPHQYKDQSNNVLVLTPDPGVVTETGTPIAAANMNKLEQVAYLLANTFSNTSGTDAYAVTIDGVSSYADLLYVPFSFTTSVANTAGCTLNVNSLGAKSIFVDVTDPTKTGDILAGAIVTLVYDGTNFQLIAPNSLVSKSGTQTLSNKTLTAPKIASVGFIADANGNELIKALTAVANAVNEVTIINSVTAVAPQIYATGDDANINLVADGKGTGVLIDRDGTKYLKEDGSIAVTESLAFSKVANMKSYKDALHFFQNANAITGTLKITLPKTWNGGDFSGKLFGYQYEGVTSNKNVWSLDFGVYNTGTSFYSASAVVSGKAPFSRVRFGHDGTKMCILLGGLTTVWNYPTVSLEHFQTSMIDVDGWGSGWSASIIASEAGISAGADPIVQGMGRYTQLTAITGPASGNYVVPAGVSAIGAFLLSGGGGGAGADTSGFGGGGGAGGNCLVIDRINVTEGQTIAYAVGGGGSGGAIGGAGGQGGTTTFSFSIAGGNGAPGSQSGNPATGTANGGTGASSGAPAVAGTSFAGNSPNVGNIFRAAGLNSFTNEFPPAGGGGGATEQFATGGAGGNGAYGNGGAGGNSGLNGAAGGFGCGGGGGGRSAATRGIGGAGGVGMLVIYELR